MFHQLAAFGFGRGRADNDVPEGLAVAFDFFDDRHHAGATHLVGCVLGIGFNREDPDLDVRLVQGGGLRFRRCFLLLQGVLYW